MLVMEGALDELRLAGGPPLISAAAAPRFAVSGARALMGGESRGPLHATAEPRSGERFLSPHTVHVSVVLGVSELVCGGNTRETEREKESTKQSKTSMLVRDEQQRPSY